MLVGREGERDRVALTQFVLPCEYVSKIHITAPTKVICYTCTWPLNSQYLPN